MQGAGSAYQPKDNTTVMIDEIQTVHTYMQNSHTNIMRNKEKGKREEKTEETEKQEGLSRKQLDITSKREGTGRDRKDKIIPTMFASTCATHSHARTEKKKRRRNRNKTRNMGPRNDAKN